MDLFDAPVERVIDQVGLFGNRRAVPVPHRHQPVAMVPRVFGGFAGVALERPLLERPVDVVLVGVRAVVDKLVLLLLISVDIRRRGSKDGRAFAVAGLVVGVALVLRRAGTVAPF